MITVGYVQKMSTYNRWMNDAIYGACDQLSEVDRKKDCGAFFGSIHATLNHLLWGNQIWMHRLAGLEKPSAPSIPESVTQYDDFDELKRERIAMDEAISAWAGNIDETWLSQELHWTSSSVNRELTSPNWLLVTHMFNHQTHHRGQVHCMLTQFAVKTPTTDLALMP